MAKPIQLTEELIAKMTEEFSENLRKARMSDGQISYTKAFTYPGKDDIRAKVWFSPVAYLKMTALINGFTSEIAWHGVVERMNDTEFIINDIVVYPQEVSGATVNTDQEGYQQWLMDLDEETANHLHMQGHSHVNMGTTPSATDISHQERIISQLSGDMFYIFMIFNKRMERTIALYDFKYNTLYENSDIDVGILGGGMDMAEFLQTAKSVVKTKVYTYGGSNYGGGSYGGSSYGGSSYSGGTGAKGGKSSGTTKGKGKNQYDDSDYLPGVDDYDDYVYNGRNRIGFHQEKMKV